MEEFQDGLGYRNGMILASPLSLPTSFGLIRLTIREQMLFVDFQVGHHGSHLRYLNGMILVVLNLHILPMLPAKIQLKLTYGLGGDVV